MTPTATGRVALRALMVLLPLSLAGPSSTTTAGPLRAGVAKIDITNTEAGPVNDRLYAKALVLERDGTRVALITVDAVAIGEIGPIGNDYLPKVRARLDRELAIPPAHVLVNASHCHGVVRGDVAERTVRAVAEASRRLVPVRVAVGTGREDRIMVNRRLRLKDGREADVRHAYALPPGSQIAAVGPVDPEIGVLRLDRADDGRTLAVVFQFACHPILGVPGGANTADISGFAARVVEENLGEGAVALFVQGCGGDINPVFYKDVDHPRHAEVLGQMLGLSTLKAVRAIAPRDDDRLAVRREVLALPRANLARRIAEMEAEQERLVGSLEGTSLNLETFLPLLLKYRLAEGGFPSAQAHEYLNEAARGRDALARLDEENRKNLLQYIRNVHAMESITRVRTNLALLRKHQAENAAAKSATVDAELVGLRVGGFVLVAFPGELTVPIGLRIKAASPHRPTFVAGYTNGYLYYTPTAEQLRNVGGAQEDSDCIVAPEWQALFERRVAEMLGGL